ncbi:PilN domain-containing protein [Candidatus Babeliales bacterium]|nr:PilN domain-containing protein [Candidatus Babeliales bacterium]
MMYGTMTQKKKLENSINFINPVPPKKQRAIVVWMYTSMISLFGILAVMSHTYLEKQRDVRRLHADITVLKQQVSGFEDSAQNKRTLIEQKESLTKEFAELKQVMRSWIPFTVVYGLAPILPHDVRLTQVSITETSLSIEGISRDVYALNAFTEKLDTIPSVKKAHLASLASRETDTGDLTTQFCVKAIVEPTEAQLQW